MKNQDFDVDLPAIWLVFGGSYLNHSNSPQTIVNKAKDEAQTTPDHREQLLVNLLSSYLKEELVSFSSKQLHDDCTRSQLATICQLLELWSEDLSLIYQVREQKVGTDSKVRQIVQRFLKRINSFNDCTCLPTGLIASERMEGHESVSVAILKKKRGCIDWIQVNPGSSYHQSCGNLVGERSNAYLEISEIDYSAITEEWLQLLLRLKTSKPREGFHYKELSLYECLLSHLNGKTVFQSQPDIGFVENSHSSPTHTWQVIDLSFRYFLRHFLGDSYKMVYLQLQMGFKLFLMEKTLDAYQGRATEQIQQCQFLLQEMCRDVAQQALDHGNKEQKTWSFRLISSVKTAIKHFCSQQEQQLHLKSQISGVCVSSLSFVPPYLNKYTFSSCGFTSSSVEADPVFVKPTMQDDIIHYLRSFKRSFIDKLLKGTNLYETALLSHGIEVFFVDYLSQTNILQKSKVVPFSQDDLYLARTLVELGEIYYGCQGRLAKHFLVAENYQPHFYAKNVIIQFFVYAAIAALNFRDSGIGPTLATLNLSTACSKSLKLTKISPHLVIEDSRWLEVLLTVQDFFLPDKKKEILFSYTRFQSKSSTLEIKNNAVETDTDVRFAYQLLQNDHGAFKRFIDDNLELEDERFNKKWVALTYSGTYLPQIYILLSKVAHCAKAALTGFPSSVISNRIKMDWSVKKKKKQRWISIVNFEINGACVITNPELSQLVSHKVKSEASYQRLVSCKDEGYSDKLRIHFLENEIIASQDEKPETMDCNRYMQLGFLQSEPQLKLQRLYIALKEQQLDFSHEDESILIKQTLFEISVFMKIKGTPCTLLEWTAHHNPELIHKLGLLLMEKAQAMKQRLTQHHAMGDILLVALGLLTFYPPMYRDGFIEGFVNIYRLLKKILAQPPIHLKHHTLLHLNAYLIISIQGNPQLLETETLTVLKSLLAIQRYKAIGIQLDNSWLLRVHEATFAWCTCIEDQLKKDPTILNKLMLSVKDKWDEGSSWQKSSPSLLYTCNDHMIKPLHCCVYHRNCPIIGLPDNIMEHKVFKEYFGSENFAVFPSSYEMKSQKVSCHFSTDRLPQVRITFWKGTLLIEEWFGAGYKRYISPQELSRDHEYPQSLFESPCSGGIYRHWLDNNGRIIIRDQDRKVVYEWNLSNGFVLSKEYNGYIVPWNMLQASFFKNRLEQIESTEWIHFIAKPSSHQSDPHLESLNFQRLGLHFDYRRGKFFSKQIHGYVISGTQHLNTLHGFSSYLILEKEGPYSACLSTKVIIPHRKVKPEGPFYVDTVFVSCNEIRSPAYFVYDFDTKLGLLKGHHIRAQLYLALLYFHSATLDDHDVSHCNAYHLARENLELCWKDQPYDEIELGIIKQFLSVEVMRDFHSHRVALYLKVVSLLIKSLSLVFLYTDEAAQRSIEKSNHLLKKQAEQLPRLLFIYLQNKSTISVRLRLTHDEEKDVINQCILPSSDKGRDAIYKDLPSFDAYYQLYIEQRTQVVVPIDSNKPFNFLYGKLFSNTALSKTAFLDLFMKQLSHFSFAFDSEGINFSFDIRGILLDQFRLVHFITLYKMAKKSVVSLKTFCYLLHHMMLKAMVQQESFPLELRLMLARALLLVAENPSAFPEAPCWFNKKQMSVNFSKRRVNVNEVFCAFPCFRWKAQKNLSNQENRVIKDKELDEYRSENKEIWSNFSRYDLNVHGIPRCLPENPDYFALQYETYVRFKDYQKRNVVRQLYLQAAYNDAMYNFFTHVLTICDTLKYQSAMGWSISPFLRNTITVTIKPNKEQALPIPEPVSLERWTTCQEPLIDLKKFFAVDSQPSESSDFLFESQLREPMNGYQHQFYSELKESWSAYQEETKCSYSWCSSQSVNELEHVLQTKYNEICKQTKEIWNHISAQFEQRSNIESNDYFALRWYSGQVRQYHKRDLLTLLIEPYKLAGYNPDCLQRKDNIIQELLQYVNHEINCSKVIRVLALIQQYKMAKDDLEKFSVLQGMVKTLQENIDPASYRYPHWFLFQLENEIIVRDNQRELIVAMLNQESKAMYQLNMGEGKSSVILPLLSHNLANGKQILRINVLSALLTTMQDFLRQRFSGLIRKYVYTLPFNRNTDISTKHLTSVFEMLEMCQHNQNILLVTPEHRLCLQLKTRELLLESQQQIGATNIFNWKTYRQRAGYKVEVYEDLMEEEIIELLTKQDQRLRTCLIDEKYIDSKDRILKIPPRGQDRTGFVKFKEIINEPTFREWSCLKSAYRELLYNSTLAQKDCSEKLALLSKINALAAIDLLDESDEILKHGTELNYTIGDKHVFAGGELRWQVPQFFIKAIFCDPDLNKIITAGKSAGLTAINQANSPQSGVPFIQLLNESFYENSIKPVLIDKFFKENLPTLRKYNTSPDKHLVQGEDSSLRRYIAGKLLLETEKKLLAFLGDKGPLKDKLLIAKGWLSHGILFHVFNAKYRVQYGLNLNAHGQTPKQIAIPFLGKDTPSPRSEFSHPDVMLGFTIISYLYQGLSQKQLKDTLVNLKGKFSHKVADALLNDWAEAGKAWIISKTSNQFPPLVLTSLQHIDLADEECLAEVLEYLSGNYLSIFFYLNQFVLLEEAMQYCYKISANAHSLVGYQPALGFSGTDDRKITMPFQIKSLCSATQKGTNGKLLSVLTQKRNSGYHSLPTEDTRSLLKHLCQYVKKKQHCHALIDAGALVTGLMNVDVAKLLLIDLPDTFLGVLYFSDEGNSLTVLTRDGKTTALQDCYLDKQNLFAYLDDIHTRGTDIQLPLNCHAILTIGMGMFKDKLMQAAMRLRQLAEKQSVSLWGIQAVTYAIARDNSITADKINSLEVIKWVTRNTINHINEDLFPVALRKINFQLLLKAEAWLKEAPATLNTLIQYCQQKELFLLEEFYALSPQCEDLADRLDFVMVRCRKKFWQELELELQSKNLIHTTFYEKVSNRADRNTLKKQLSAICEEVIDFLQRGYVHQSLEDDEEKEVEVEIVQEQQVLIKMENRRANEEAPWDVRLLFEENFIKVAEQIGIIMPLHLIQKFIQVPACLKNVIWHSDIYMTDNFILSVEGGRKGTLDNYLRPVDVILMHRSSDKSSAVLLSGREASHIKSVCQGYLGENLLIHMNDVNGPTQLPVNRTVSKEEHKLLTIIKLFSGECHFVSSKEILRLAKRVGRIHPHYFKCVGYDADKSEKIFESLIQDGYLNFAGVMTEKLLEALCCVKSGNPPLLDLAEEYASKAEELMKKLHGIFTKLIFQSSCPLQENHYILWQWIGTRRRLREYPGSVLESIINSEYQIKLPLKSTLLC